MLAMAEMAEMVDMQLVVVGMEEMEEIVDLVMEETGDRVVMVERLGGVEEMVATEHKKWEKSIFLESRFQFQL